MTVDKRWSDSCNAVPSLTWTSSSTVGTDWTLQQLAPYIGRMKTSMARSLVDALTTPGDLVVDPFCGSGVVALEAAASGRKVVAGDLNPYAVVLTKAKLFPPPSFEAALKEFNLAWRLSLDLRKQQDLRKVPSWVRSFFHNETLRDALAFRDACVRLGNDFLLACLLGILHHQRPGFLSYPSSHLVPYLRGRKYPLDGFPQLYEKRDVGTRVLAKVTRTYRRFPPRITSGRVMQIDARRFPSVGNVQAVITSPPYMNELDYVRDNRLRLWFIDRRLPLTLEIGCHDRLKSFTKLLETSLTRVCKTIAPEGFLALVLGEASRRGRTLQTADIAQSIIENSIGPGRFKLVGKFYDEIPDIRRSRRDCKGTKVETILIYKKRSR